MKKTRSEPHEVELVQVLRHFVTGTLGLPKTELLTQTLNEIGSSRITSPGVSAVITLIETVLGYKLGQLRVEINAAIDKCQRT